MLVTGPTGSGKTTTLYSTLRTLATPDVNVCTVEDPIEMVASELNQSQVHHGIGFGFAQGVRTLLRQDPDIIMIGEIRDLETAEMAIQAALTGHLVLSTLHTNDAPSAITRLLDLGLPHYPIASTLNGILAQRLVRTLSALQRCVRSRPKRGARCSPAPTHRPFPPAPAVGRLPGVPQDRLPGAGGHLRADAGHPPARWSARHGTGRLHRAVVGEGLRTLRVAAAKRSRAA